MIQASTEAMKRGHWLAIAISSNIYNANESTPIKVHPMNYLSTGLFSSERKSAIYIKSQVEAG